MKKKQVITIGACSAGGLLLLAAAFLLFRSVAEFRRLDATFERLQADLGRFYQADAFPSLANVKRERENREQVDEWYTSLMAELQKGNVSSSERSPSRFVGVLERARNRLMQQAIEQRVRLPQGAEPFGFGFERYVGTGRLPEPDDVPRLTEQLILVTRLTRILFGSEVASIQQIERDALEGQLGAQAAQGPSTRGSARSSARRSSGSSRRTVEEPPPPSDRKPGVIPEGGDYGMYRFGLTFTARESALRDVLNKLVSAPTFIVVRAITIQKDVPQLLMVPSEGTTPETATSRRAPAADVSFLFGGGEETTSAEAAASTLSEKMLLGPSHPVSGIEMEIPMEVHLELDVYKFRGLDEAGN